MHKTEVKIIIPIYKTALTDLEKRSIEQAYTVLSRYPIVVVKPHTLDLSRLHQTYPALSFESFDDLYFSNIQGYNRLMLSQAFYTRFLDSRYILIYQLDAFVFSDSLLHWCSKAYDYVAAPWLTKEVYTRPILSSILRFCIAYAKKRGKKSRFALHNKVGNGGLSLRKVAAFHNATIRYNEKITDYLSQKRSHLFNEDVFWSTEMPDFRYPSVEEALQFSFDKYPAYCYELNNRQLPFGCHAWYKKKMKSFWQPIIHF